MYMLVPSHSTLYLFKPLRTRLRRVKILHLQLPLNVYPWQTKPHNRTKTLPIQLRIPVTIDQSPLTNPFSVSLLGFAIIVSIHHFFPSILRLPLPQHPTLQSASPLPVSVPLAHWQ